MGRHKRIQLGHPLDYGASSCMAVGFNGLVTIRGVRIGLACLRMKHQSKVRPGRQEADVTYVLSAYGPWESQDMSSQATPRRFHLEGPRDAKTTSKAME